MTQKNYVHPDARDPSKPCHILGITHVRKARKEHRCIWCRTAIAPGDSYDRVAVFAKPRFRNLPKAELRKASAAAFAVCSNCECHIDEGNHLERAKDVGAYRQ